MGEGRTDTTRAAMRSTCQLLLFNTTSDSGERDDSFTLLLLELGGGGGGTNWNHYTNIHTLYIQYNL